MEIGDHSRLAIGLSHLPARDLLLVKPSYRRKAYECNDCSHEAKQDNGAEVGKELLPLHIEAACKHDRWQTDEEEQIVIEFHQLCKFMISGGTVSIRNSEAYESHKTSLVAKWQGLGWDWDIDDEHEAENDETLIEDTFLFLVFF